MQTHGQQLGCRGTGWASPGMAGPDMPGLEHARGRFRFWEGRGGHPEVGVPLAGAHICTDVLCAHSCLQPRPAPAPRGISPERCPWPVTAVLPALDAGDTRPAQA